MPLWTDIDCVTADDLTSLDSEVKSVAAVNEVTLDDPTAGMIHRAVGEAANTLISYQQVFGGYLSNQNVSGNHYNAVMNVGLPAINRQRILLNQIVPSGVLAAEFKPLKSWTAYWCLHFLFRELANRTMKDRYLDKARNYKAEASGRYLQDLRTQGIPIVRQPLPAPGALYEPAVSGIFDTPNVTAVAGTSNGGTFDVAITWVDQRYYLSPSNKANAESAPSQVVTLTVASGNVLRINVNGLTAPNGVQHPSTLPKSVVPYGVATGWNVYAGVSGGTLYLQNATPIPTGIVQGSATAGTAVTQTTSYTLAADPVASGNASDQGQFADLFFTFQNVMQRA